jgi:hypothetical protein
VTDSVRLCLYEAFDILWAVHLKGRPSARAYTPSRKALVRSFGGKYLDEITPFDYREHRRKRLAGEYPFNAVGLGSVFHDHGLLNLVYSKFEEWKVDGLKPDGVDLSQLALPMVWPTFKSKKTRPPKNLIEWTPPEFRAVYRVATRRLRRVMIGLIDLDIRQNDLERLRTGDYNPYDDHLHWTQKKTGKAHSLPVTGRVRRQIIEARRSGWDFIYDTTNIVKEFRQARHESGVRKILTLRALRKTAWNAIKRRTGDASKASQVAGHASTRTGTEHYEIPTNEGLRKSVNHVSRMFATSSYRRK